MKNIHVLLPDKEVDFIDNLIELDFYQNRAEIIRQALKDWIQKESHFLSTFNSDTKKLKDLHRKFREFDFSLKEQHFPVYSPSEKEG